MKRFIIATGMLALAAPLGMAQAAANSTATTSPNTTTWVSDPAHSEVDFVVTHLSISKVHGRFGKVAATVEYDEKDVSRSSVTATIEVGTVDTSEEARNNHLKTPAFFDVVKFPVATFASTSVDKSADGLTVNGNLTLHGVTRPLVLKVEGPIGPVTGPDKKQHAGFSATTKIKRSDFGIGTSMPASMVGDEVQLTIELDVAKQ